MLRIANAALLFTKCTLAFPTDNWTQEFGFLWWSANLLASPFLVTSMNCSIFNKKYKQAGTICFDSKVQHQLFCYLGAMQTKASLPKSFWHSSSSLSVSHSNTSSFLFRLQMGEASCYLVRWIGMIFSFTYTFLLQIFLLLSIGCYIPVSFKFGRCGCTTTVLLTRGRYDVKISGSTH